MSAAVESPVMDNPRSPAASDGSNDLYNDDEDWTRRAWEAFALHARRGVLDFPQFIQWASELNVECDTNIVKRVVPKQNWNKIPFDVAVKALEVIPTLVLEEGVEEENGAAGELKGEHEKGVVLLSPFRYIWTVWLCGKADPETTYKVSWHLVSVSPRFWLIFNASLVFLLVAGAILGFMSYLWLENAESRESSVLRQLEQTLLHIVTSISENTLSVSGHDLLDQAVTLSRFLERLKRVEGEQFVEELKTQHTVDTQLVSAQVQNTQQYLLLEMSERMAALQKYSDANRLGISALMGITAGWVEKSPSWSAVVYNLRSMTVQWTSVVFGSTAEQNTFNAAVERMDCIRELRKYRSGEMKHTVGLTGVGNSTATYRFVPGEMLGICLSIEPDALTKLARQRLVENINEANSHAFRMIDAIDNGAPPIELTLGAWVWQREQATPSSTGGARGNRTFQLETTPSFSSFVCAMPGKKQHCAAFLKFMEQCAETQCAHSVHRVRYYNSVEVIAVMTYVSEGNFVLAHSVDAEVLEQKFGKQLRRIVNSINKKLTESTLELALAARDTATGKLIPQVTDYKFAGDCYGECARIPESVAAIFNTFATGGSGYAFYPDYRPAPIVGGFCHLLNDINQTFIVERDVTEIRTANLYQIVAAVDSVNQQAQDTTEIVIFREKGVPVSQTFDPHAPCPENVICDYHPTLGAIARSDCRECLMLETANEEEGVPMYETKVRFSHRCVGCDVSNPELPGADHRAVKDAFRYKMKGAEHNGPDYSHVHGKYFYSFVDEMSTFILVKRDTVDIKSQVLSNIVIGIAIAAAVVAAGVIVLLLFSRRVLNRIEHEWKRATQGLEFEKNKFDKMMEEVIPSSVMARYRRGLRTVVENLPSVCYACLDVCSFTEKVCQKGVEARPPVRTAAYYFILYQTVAKKFGMFRLKTYGDVAMYCNGINSRKTSNVTSARDAYSATCFAATVLELLSSVYAHYPQRLPAFREICMGDDEDMAMRIVPVRIGLHCGQVLAGMVDIGTTLLYEHYGAPLALTHRLQATCPPGRAHASSVFKDFVESVDAANSFEFDTLRKTMIKGRTTASYPLRSAQIVIDQSILTKLSISYAEQLYEFACKQGQRSGGQGGTLSDGHSREKHSSYSSSSGGRGSSSKDSGSQVENSTDSSAEYPKSTSELTKGEKSL